ncbi:Citrate synthase, mitochondrial [Beauveria bassiana]|uniref:Citrate synthase, mitochondrial n=1 Tax=Beauveria bassiana TaxID=176275 RepID=A0A2N6P2K5_BEABA|nr:Citrate synthase, mitochondrial [Beauveria bassiana]
MASVTRLSNSALKASLRAPAFGARSAAFNSVRCYSAKTQTLKERFAELLPEKIDQIKALRAFVTL